MEPFKSSGIDPVLEVDEKLMGKWKGLDLYFGTKRVGTGGLLITSKRCVWIPENAKGCPAAGTGYALSWDDLGMHAVCSDANAFHCPHIFCLVDRELLQEAEEGDETHDTTNEIRIAPVEPEECRTLLDRLFTVFSDAASMSPETGAFSGTVVHTGDFNRKRKFDDVTPTQGEGTDPFVLHPDLAEYSDVGFGIPGSGLTEEEMERKMAEWESKLVIAEDFDTYQPK
eukprot:TRINITY_DN4885_c1_g1_i1.p1 TRINITY_DN4885_c1_g1~~TRINITY_DN4885_c1_g1_i1.p1  ORF type:complete len:246 (+),score=97.49 TRINITY_DN4885_c1_g1_i1:60-740(+)